MHIKKFVNKLKKNITRNSAGVYLLEKLDRTKGNSGVIVKV